MGICFLAFEWRSYESTKSKNWIYIEDVMDTLRPPQPISIPKPKAQKIPQLKPNTDQIEIVKNDIELLEGIIQKDKKKETNSSVEENHDLWTDEDDTEEIVGLGFKLPLKNPQSKPFFNSKPCLRLSSNFDRYRYSIQNIQRKIQTRLYRPDMLAQELEFTIHFKIDTTGQIIDVKLEGTTNKNIISSAEQIMYQLPKMNPAIHEGEKRVMETGIPVRIIY